MNKGRPTGEWLALSCAPDQRVMVLAAVHELGLNGYWMPYGDRDRTMVAWTEPYTIFLGKIGKLTAAFDLHEIDWPK